MQVIISDYAGEHSVEVSDQRERAGHRVLNGGSFLNTSPGHVCFIENVTNVGGAPWIGYAHIDEATGQLSEHIVRMPLEKSRIIRVIS